MLQNIHSQLHKGSNSDSKPAPGFLGTAASHITSGTSKTPILSAVSSAVTHPLTHLPFVAGNSRKFRIPTNEDHERVSALFLGPKAENAPMLRACLDLIVSKQTGTRQSYCPEDQDFITTNIQSSSAYKEMSEKIYNTLSDLLDNLGKSSIPFYSPRYSAHMSVDQSLPAILGYLSTLFYNPNNVAFEASPLTTLIELEVGREMCTMLGYSVAENTEDKPVGWGHITCDGSVANLEAVWVARNLKFYPLSLREAIRESGPLAFIADTFKVETCAGDVKLVKELDSWDLLNLKVKTVVEIPERLYKEYLISATYLENAMNPYLVQTIGKDAVMKMAGVTKDPILLVPSTKHYSWPKAAAICGIGSDNAVNVPIDTNARLDTTALQKMLHDANAEKRAVYIVTAVMGTTEEGAVDRLADMADIRDNMQSLGLSFVLHADAAWGGYFASMLKRDVPYGLPTDGQGEYVPHVGLRADTEKHLYALAKADSITIDPHKAGYIPYPAGGLCYRDGRMRYLVTWEAPYLHQGAEGESIGVYGVEGSKPGAAACAVYMAHQVVGLTPDGHGALLGEAAFTCRRFSSHWAAMSDNKTDFIVVPFNPIPAELAQNSTPEMVEAQKQFIRERIIPKQNEDLVQDQEAMLLLNQLGSDLNINVFACNFKRSDGTVNTDIEEANWLNRRLFERFSVTSSTEDPLSIPFYLTSTTLAGHEYGVCADELKRRLGLEGKQDLFVLRNVVMSPFTTTRDFVSDLAKIFQQALQEEVVNVRRRNDATPSIHTFLTQGTDKLHFVHRPVFHQQNGRYQFIFSATLSQTAMDKYKAVAQTNSQVELHNKNPMLLPDIVDGRSFPAQLVVTSPGKQAVTIDVDASGVKIVKKRSLMLEDLDSEYPNLMPFYLYGTPEQVHVDHMLLFAPNIQLTGAQVRSTFDTPLSAADLATGVIAIAQNIREITMQPFAPMENLQPSIDQGTFFFTPGKKLDVIVYRDPYPTSTDDPVDLDQVTEVLTKGTLELVGGLYVDSDSLNADIYTPKEETPFNTTVSGKMTNATAQGWVGALGKLHEQVHTDVRSAIGRK